MTDHLEVVASREFSGELSIRDAGEGRTVYGLVVPYNQPATVNDGRGPYQEAFAPGAFARSAAQRNDKVKLYVNHNHRTGQLPVGRSVALRDTPMGVEGEFVVSKTRDGDDALTLVRDGAVDAFSVGFRSITSKKIDGVVVRTEAALREVSLVGIPAYDGALIAGVRSEFTGLTDEELIAHLEALPEERRAELLVALRWDVPALTPGTDNVIPANDPGSPGTEDDMAARHARIRAVRRRLSVIPTS